MLNSNAIVDTNQMDRPETKRRVILLVSIYSLAVFAAVAFSPNLGFIEINTGRAPTSTLMTPDAAASTAPLAPANAN